MESCSFVRTYRLLGSKSSRANRKSKTVVNAPWKQSNWQSWGYGERMFDAPFFPNTFILVIKSDPETMGFWVRICRKSGRVRHVDSDRWRQVARFGEGRSKKGMNLAWFSPGLILMKSWFGSGAVQAKFWFRPSWILTYSLINTGLVME